MALEYSGHYIYQAVKYEPVRTNLSNKYIFEIQSFITMLNLTIKELYKTYNNAYGVVLTGACPFFSYDDETCLISFTAISNLHTNYPSNSLLFPTNSLLNPINIYVNVNLLAFIEGLPVFYDSTKTYPYKILVFDTGYNLITINNVQNYKMTQQDSSFESMSNFVGLSFTSNIMTQNEYVSQQIQLEPRNGDVLINNQSAVQGSSFIPSNILQDYVMEDLTIDHFHNYAIWNAYTPYRQSEIISDGEIYSIHIDVRYTTIEGTQHEIKVAPNQAAQIKLMFTKRIKNKYA
jgi:hypothetical protein